MQTYQVTLGKSADIIIDIMIVRTKNFGEAERKAIKRFGGDTPGLHAIKIEELGGTFVK